MKKFVLILIAFSLIFNINYVLYAETETNSKIEDYTEVSAQAENAVENILSEFDNNSEDLQKKVDDIMEKNSESIIVKIFKRIMNAVARFLDAIFEVALEATKVR